MQTTSHQSSRTSSPVKALAGISIATVQFETADRLKAEKHRDAFDKFPFPTAPSAGICAILAIMSAEPFLPTSRSV